MFEWILMSCVGVYATALGFGYLPPPAIKDEREWRTRYQPWLRILGPIITVLALILAYDHAFWR
jgi:hypothetical protein